MLNPIEVFKNISDNTIETYLGMPPIINGPRCKCRLGSTKHKKDKEKQKRLKRIAKNSKRRNLK